MHLVQRFPNALILLYTASQKTSNFVIVYIFAKY